jgi:hypothetical protein
VKAYGEATANVVGFMDDLTPCRTPKGKNGIPWFRLNTTFMDVRKNRLFSGPPTHFGYCANTKDEAIKTFVWYGLARTFAHCGYPLWVDNCEMWPLKDGVALNTGLKYSLALAYAENDCVSVEFPANNPVAGAPLVRVDNPMSPMYSQSFWNKELKPLFDSVNCASGTPKSLVDAVSELYMRWKKELRGRADVSVNFDKSYFIGNHTLFLDSGINQIRDYAIAQNSQSLLEQLEKIGVVLKLVKEEFYELLRSKTDLNYFGVPQQAQKSAVRPKLFVAKTKFQKVLEKRLCLASLIVDRLQDDENFGRTKFTKLFYLSDVSENLALETDYYREAAGPLDQRCLYNQQIGIEAMASRHGYFTTRQDGPAIRYRPGENLEELISAARTLFDPQTVEKVLRLIEICRPLETDQAEIIATLYACWNDFLLDRKQVTDDFLIQEFLKRWHPDKTQFSKARLQNALRWMRKEKLVPTGTGKHTSILFKDA